MSLDGVELDGEPRPGPEDAAFTALLAEPVHEALALLPVVQREALVLTYWGGSTQREVAALPRAPLGTVKTRTRNGILTLARMLADLDRL